MTRPLRSSHTQPLPRRRLILGLLAAGGLLSLGAAPGPADARRRKRKRGNRVNTRTNSNNNNASNSSNANTGTGGTGGDGGSSCVSVNGAPCPPAG